MADTNINPFDKLRVNPECNRRIKKPSSLTHLVLIGSYLYSNQKYTYEEVKAYVLLQESMQKSYDKEVKATSSKTRKSPSHLRG